MEIYTSNYSRRGTAPGAVAISVGPPTWYHSRVDRNVAPTWNMVMEYRKGEISQLEYVDQYIDLLNKRNFNADDFVSRLPHPCAYLICYESPGKFCHRRVLAAVIESELGLTVPEWETEKEFISNQQRRQQAELVDNLLEF